MFELELQQYLLRNYPQENAHCEWKEYKNLKNSFCGDEKKRCDFVCICHCQYGRWTFGDWCSRQDIGNCWN